MRRSLAAFSLVLAWLCANGAALEVAQVFAWSRMFAGYVEILPVAEALKETFDPAKPCAICQAIAVAKQSAEQHAPTAVEQAAKVVLALHPVADPIVAPRLSPWPAAVVAVASSRREPVPVPPPRGRA